MLPDNHGNKDFTVLDNERANLKADSMHAAATDNKSTLLKHVFHTFRTFITTLSYFRAGTRVIIKKTFWAAKYIYNDDILLIN
jgi:hypothetical protein